VSKNDGTPPEITAILNWQKAHAGQVPYSETASTRLAFDTAHLTSATDCSGMVARMFAHFAGLTVGTWTGNERNYGQLVTTSKADAAAGKGMLPGDVILFNWSGPNPNFDHIAIYAGAGRIWNHGGPGKGPLDWSLASNVNAATNVMVRRFITPTTANAQEDDMDLTKANLADIAKAVWVFDNGGKSHAWALLNVSANPARFAAALLAALPPAQRGGLTETDVETAVRKVLDGATIQTGD